MRIGIPQELKPMEGRVGLIPAACGELIQNGHKVFVEKSAGVKSGYSDEQYRAVGASVVEAVDELYNESEMIVKVKEPIEPDLEHLRQDHLLFCFLHLAASPELTERLKAIGLTAIAFETVEDTGRLPLLAPMSDIAGRLSIQIGTHLLHQPQGGKGILLGGVPAAKRGKVVILGSGVAGGNAAVVAAALGSETTIFDKNREKLEWARGLGPNVTGLYPYPHDITEALINADLVVGAVLVTGKRTPHIITAEMVQRLHPGSVIVDISVDQGGCVETTEPRTYDHPTYVWEGITHFTVTNMPAAVPRTASQTLSAAITPYVDRMAGSSDWREYPPLAKGINVEAGQVVHPALLQSSQ